MKIRTRILAFQLVVTTAIVLMAVVAYLNVQSTNWHIDRVRWSRDQLDAVTRLQVRANRYSEQIAELLVLGEAERPDLESARVDMSGGLTELRRLEAGEAEALRRFGEDQPGAEASRLEQMASLYRQVDGAVERMLLLAREGRQREAVELFRTEIENRLDAELEDLIGVAVEEERREVANADTGAQERSRWLGSGSYAILAALLATVLAAGYVLTRSLRGPIDALTRGTEALAQGDLSFRIEPGRDDELGQVARRFNAMADELERQQHALEGARRGLEVEVSQRTAELSEANRQLKELDKARVAFLADVSHELRTPLTVLRGEAEVTLRGASKPESVYRTSLAAIVDQCAAIGRLVDDLLFLARSEADEIRFEPMLVSLPQIVAEASEEAALLAPDREIRLMLPDAPEDTLVRADPRRLKQALLIVLDNARKYSGRRGEIRVEIGASNGATQVRISDQGPGIPPEELSKVFDRFYRGTNVNSESGSGLGLSIARWIVEKHEGRIELRSSPGEGTEVRIDLPMADAA